jgi:hypothetical protein
VTLWAKVRAGLHELANRFVSTVTGGSLVHQFGLAVLVSTLLLPVIVLASYFWARLPYPIPDDFSWFGPSGADILLGHWAQVFADPAVQAGPLELLPFGVAEILGLSGAFAWTLFYVCMSYLATLAFTLTVFITLGPASKRWYLYLGLIGSGIACIGGFLPNSVIIGHPSEVVIPLLWIVAGCLARERCFATCGIIIALSAGWELWGVLGAPVILLAARPQLFRAAVAGILTLVAIYGPFLATGVFGMFQFQWTVSNTSLTHVLLPALTSFPWSLRLLQAVFAVGVGCAIAFCTRGTVYAVWLVPMAILSSRLLLDPVLYNYYWLAPAVVSIGMMVSMLQLRQWIFAGLVFAVVICLWFPTLLSLPGALVLFGLTVAAGVLVARYRKVDAESPQVDPQGATLR